MAETTKLDPNLYGGIAYFYANPNPALSEILIGEGVQGVVFEYTARVTQNYLNRLGARKHIDDRHIGGLEGAVRPEVFIGGMSKDDRWIGGVSVEIEYAMADEVGRHTPAEGQRGSTYEGSHDLSGALYAELPAEL